MAGINRQAIVDDVLSGQAVMAQGPVMPDNWAFFDGQEAYRFDPDNARQMLLGMGFTQTEGGALFYDGAPIALNLLVQDDLQHITIAQMLKANWENLGLSIEVVSKPYDQVLADLNSRDYQMALIDIDLSNRPDPDPYQFWAESQIANGQNYSQWSNATASSYLEQGRQTANAELRIKLYRNFQVLFEEELPSLPLFYPVYNYAVKDSIQGLTLGPIYDQSDRFNKVQEWYILTGVE